VTDMKGLWKAEVQVRPLLGTAIYGSVTEESNVNVCRYIGPRIILFCIV